MTLLEDGIKNVVTIFQAYVCHRIRNGSPIGNDYLSIMIDAFDDYCVAKYIDLMDAVQATPRNLMTTALLIS